MSDLSRTDARARSAGPGRHGRIRRFSHDDSGSMPLAILLTVVGVTLSAVMASVTADQLGASRWVMQRNHAVDAAQAGLDAALGQIRFAANGPPLGLENAGVLASLPCGPIAGWVGAGSKGPAYRATIVYLDRSGNAIPCIDAAGTGTTPITAALSSTGTDEGTAVSRTLTANYTFRTTNKNIPGGLIPVFRTSGSNDLCLDAGSGSPSAGDYLTVQPCAPGSDSQTFTYNTNLTLALESSVTTATPLGMCLDAGAVPHTATAPVALQPCGAVTQPRQQWAFNDAANFEGTSDGAGLDGYCFNVLNPDMAGSSVSIKKGGAACYTAYNITSSFTPQASVGAGASSGLTGQLVNYGQFGRCLDVTETNVNYKYLIDWPCKQAPDSKNILWNQKWSLPTATALGTSGQIFTKPTAPSKKCLQSPLSTAWGLFVVLVDCPLPTNSATQWKVYSYTGVYASSFRIEDDAGNCLAATDPAELPAREMYPKGASISPIIVVACTGSTLQKWNADPEVLRATPLHDIGEK